KAPVEEQRTSTSRGTNNQQRNKEPAPVEDQRSSRGTKNQRSDKEMRVKNQFVCMA
ncbi:hypothetical protein Gotur_001245, partial [Gossypium turneri]